MSVEDEYERLKKVWELKLLVLVGRKIKKVRYLNPEEVGGMGWRSSALVLVLDDGTLIWPMSDDEGNNAGALAVQRGRLTQSVPETVPVI